VNISTKERVGSLISILAITILSIYIYLEYESIINFFLNTSPVFRNLVLTLLGFFGAISVLIPIPYTALIFSLSSIYPGLEPLETSLFVGLGSGLGEITGWIVGRSIKNIIWSDGRSVGKNFMVFLSHEMEKRAMLIPVLIFLFALTPLPDDVLLIILGAMNYSLIKALIPCMLGKILMVQLLVMSGKAVGWLAGPYIGTSGVVVLAIALIFLSYFIMAVMFKRLRLSS
jgi:membrane protein YqaA with SNARE-associated domain